MENLSAHPELHLIDGGVEGGAEADPEQVAVLEREELPYLLLNQ